jgi:DNA-binding NarL/FixJ family response regulator
MNTSLQPLERPENLAAITPANGASRTLRGPRATTRENPAGLTVREVQVLKLLAQGFTTARLARVLYRSPRTVDHHVEAILYKLGAHSRAQAVAAAFNLGIVAVNGGSLHLTAL